MIAIDFHDQAGLVQRLGENLVGPHPSCWDVVLPPGFGEERFAQQLEEFLRGHSRHPRVAVQGADHSNPTIAEFVRALHWQWEETEKPPKALDRSASMYLDILLKSLRPSERPIVLVLKRFHKVLDNLEKWVLGKLRREEQNKRLHTVIITPLPLATLKKRWEAQKHYFCTSDYGDSRHTPVTVAPPDPEEVDLLCESLGIFSGVNAYTRQLTGGYPEHFASLLEWWDNQGRPQLTPAVRAEMLKLACGQLNVFLEWLDPLEDGLYRDHVIDLYHGVNTDQAQEAFQNHPWRDIVLDKEGLRAEALGAGALSAALRDTAGRKTFQSPWYDVLERARLLYDRHQYETALRVLGTVDTGRLRPQDRVLQAHARIMVELAGEEGDEHFGGDTNCRRLCHALREAREILTTVALPLSAADRQKVEGRYGQLEVAAAAISAAGSITGWFQNRLVDVLAGFAGREHQNVRGAVLLLLVKAEAGKAIAGDGSACQFVMALPEQIFRTWALWALNLNYYQAPAVDEAMWQIVEFKWLPVHGVVRRATPGNQFPNFFVFTIYALACLQSLPPDRQAVAPEAGFKELQSALSSYESVRTGNAHGLYQPNKRQRQTYFDLIDRWFTSLLAVCPDRVTREELLELTEPLPVMNADGSVFW